MSIPGWSTVFGKVAQWIPSKEQARRNKYDAFNKEKANILAEKAMYLRGVCDENTRIKVRIIDERVRVIDNELSKLAKDAINT